MRPQTLAFAVLPLAPTFHRHRWSHRVMGVANSRVVSVCNFFSCSSLFVSLRSILSWKLLPQGSEPELTRSPLPRAPRSPLVAPASHCPLLDLIRRIRSTARTRGRISFPPSRFGLEGPSPRDFAGSFGQFLPDLLLLPWSGLVGGRVELRKESNSNLFRSPSSPISWDQCGF